MDINEIVVAELPWLDADEALMRDSRHESPQQSSVMRRCIVFFMLVSLAWAAKSLLSGSEKGYDAKMV